MRHRSKRAGESWTIRRIQVIAALTTLGVTHVVWLPDSALGPWESALEQASSLRLIRVAREGEAWAIAAGLHLGGQRPLVMIQNTGLFESGDALRNVLFDLGLPLWAVVGYRMRWLPVRPIRPGGSPSPC